MRDNSVSAIPVVDSDGHPVGIVTATDFLDDLNEGTPVSHVMAEPVFTVPRYDGPHVAARMEGMPEEPPLFLKGRLGELAGEHEQH